MTLRSTRTLLWSHLLRTGQTRRIARLVARLEPGELQRLVREVAALELRHAARVLLDDEHLAATLEALDDHHLARVLEAAADEDALRALSALRTLRVGPRRRANRVLALLEPARRDHLARRLGEGSNPIGAVLRLGRLFA